jgi:integrase/recombinase XerD
MRSTFGDLCRFTLLTGMRLSEVAGLKQTDARGGKAQLWQTKHKFRVIRLCEEAQAIVAKQPKGEYVFTTRPASERDAGAYRRVTEMWREVVLRAQKMAQKQGRSLTRMRFHDLRHEFAIRYLENGGSLLTLQKHLGHSSLKQTEWYLTYLTPEQAALVSTASAQEASQ